MFQMTKRLVEARAPQGLDQEEMKRFVFKELYGFDMPDKGDAIDIDQKFLS